MKQVLLYGVPVCISEIGIRRTTMEMSCTSVAFALITYDDSPLPFCHVNNDDCRLTVSLLKKR